MKKISILCTFIFIIGMMTSSSFAQDPCLDDTDCEPFKCDVDSGDCMDVECTTDAHCDTDMICQDYECVDVPMVSVDIKPGACPNPLNVRSQGVLPVAIFGSDVIDLETIDSATIWITREGVEGAALVPPIRYSYDDVGTPYAGDPCICDDLDEDGLEEDDPISDGITDLILKFSVQELVSGLLLNDVESKEIIPLTIMWETDDATFMEEDCVKIINNFKWLKDILEKIKKPKKPKKPKNGDEE